MSPEELQTALCDYLDGIDWTGDTERIAQQLADKHSRGVHVIGFRRRGNEVLLHRDRVLTVHELCPSGQIIHVGTVWRQRDLEEWLERNHHYLEWIHPDHRPQRIVS